MHWIVSKTSDIPVKLTCDPVTLPKIPLNCLKRNETCNETSVKSPEIPAKFTCELWRLWNSRKTYLGACTCTTPSSTSGIFWNARNALKHLETLVKVYEDLLNPYATFWIALKRSWNPPEVPWNSPGSMWMLLNFYGVLKRHEPHWNPLKSPWNSLNIYMKLPNLLKRF